MFRAWTAAGLLTALAAGAGAQSYSDLTMVRNRPSAYAEVLKVRAGALYGFAEAEDEAGGLESKLGLDGHVYYRTDQFGGRETTLEAYGGRDGVYLAGKDNLLLGAGNQTRLELSGRLWPFWREGFYRDGDFVPTGRYEGRDYGALLGLSREADEGLRIELAAYWRRFSFDRNDDTAPGYVIPDDFDAYGPRVTLEHNTLTLSRQTGRPEQGFIATIAAEREWNSSDATFGVTGTYTSRLPSAVWRGRAHLEWYAPQSDTGTWELRADGSWSHDNDRVYNYDAQKPQGSLWVDAEVGYRLDWGSLALTPNVRGQFVRILDEVGASTDNEFFVGGGLRSQYDLGGSFSVLLEYSYLSNESREPVGFDEDTFGEHRVFFGIEFTIGGTAR
jgi:hypothetical protein